MPTRITENRLSDFVAALKEAGRTGNRALRQRLGWNDEDFYWKVQGRLIESGKIAPGRGKGGSVHLADVQEERAFGAGTVRKMASLISQTKALKSVIFTSR